MEIIKQLFFSIQKFIWIVYVLIFSIGTVYFVINIQNDMSYLLSASDFVETMSFEKLGINNSVLLGALVYSHIFCFSIVFLKYAILLIFKITLRPLKSFRVGFNMTNTKSMMTIIVFGILLRVAETLFMGISLLIAVAYLWWLDLIYSVIIFVKHYLIRNSDSEVLYD